MSDLIKKYNVPVPRYTSYPPANFFHAHFSEEDLRKAIALSNTQEPRHLSFYIHIPFCVTMCHYCGCNSYPMQRDVDVRAYIDALLHEIELVCANIDQKRKIAQIHYGGGTPTAIPGTYIQMINERLLSKFDCIEEPEIAIECHPGNMDENDFLFLIDAGFNRMSIGIQDFNQEVLKAVNRIPPKIPVETIVNILKEKNIRINFDFIYGLPLQSIESFTETIQKAVELSPDRIVTFSYAHVPHLFKRQTLLEKKSLPKEMLKKNLYETGRRLLLAGDYRQVGIDHFVKKTDELHRAVQEGTLHRNFQGYCTRRTTGQVYAFGVTAISQLASAYAQNTKDIDEYIATVHKNRIPVKKGYALNAEEQITRAAIIELMCNEQLDWTALSERLHTPVSEIKVATAYSEKKIQQFADDGLLTFEENKLIMSEKGSPFVRNVAASLDKLMKHNDKKFSKPI